MSIFIRSSTFRSLRWLSLLNKPTINVNRCSLHSQSIICPRVSNYRLNKVDTFRALSSAAEETHEQSTVKNVEVPKGEAEKKEFQAETRMLLDIVARSLYSDKEVFIRELISNASDALEKFRYLSVCDHVDKESLQEVDRPLEIRISTDKQSRIITIQDSGIGMSREELVQNLGTIARSGSKSFLEEIKGKGAEQASTIIGQFGVGFYSAFMVADNIQVFTRSAKDESVGLKWSSDGSGTYEIQEADGVSIGTKIVIHLKADSREFSDDNTVKDIIKKYSNFIGSAIYLNDERVNSIQPIWLMDAKAVSDEQHTEFYKYISNSYDKPRYVLQYRTDAPLSIRAALYIPEGKPGLFEMSRDADAGVALYSRKILIKSKAENVLPKWLRFVKGVVDSEDIPLNLSREILQNSALITKLRTVLTNRILKFLQDKAGKDPAGYDDFYKDYAVFLKEGIVTSHSTQDREEISKLLRFESSQLEAGKKMSLTEYCDRQKDGQKDIYYLAAPSRALAESSPYFESLKKRNAEVLFCYDMYDELVLLELRQFSGRNLVSAENQMQEDSKEPQDTVIGSDSLSKSEVDELAAWMKSVLAGKVFGVRATRQLDQHPCVVSVGEMAAARHFMRTQAHNMPADNRYNILQPHLEINPKHPLIKKLQQLHAGAGAAAGEGSSAQRELCEMLVRQLFSNAMVAAGLELDPRELIANINELLTRALDKHTP